MSLRLILRSIFLGSLLWTFSSGALADEQKITDLIKQKFPNVELEQVNKVKGIELYEIVFDGDLVYVDSNLKYFIDGNLIDLSTMKNITRARKDFLEAKLMEKLAIPLEEFPLDWALTKTQGDGSRKVAYFADPNCGYCKRFERGVLPKMENVTVYIFPYPIISEKSLPLARSIWCSSNREAAWDNYVLNGISPKNKGECETPIENILAFGKKMRIRGTPTLFFPDGTRVPGMMGVSELNQKLDDTQ